MLFGRSVLVHAILAVVLVVVGVPWLHVLLLVLVLGLLVLVLELLMLLLVQRVRIMLLHVLE